MKSHSGCFSMGVLLIVCLATTTVGAEEESAVAVRPRIAKSIALLETASAETAKQRSCFTCHGQAMPVFVFAEAKLRGFEIDESNLEKQLDHTLTFIERGRKNYLKGKGQGGRVDMAGYALWALEVGERKPDESTAAIASYIIGEATASGYWRHSSKRPPSEGSDFTTTYLALRALTAYGTGEQQSKIEAKTAAAKTWLLKTSAKDTEDRVFQLRALSYLAVDQSKQDELVEQLLTGQRDDGGWAQKEDLTSDAYATGLVLVGLLRVGAIKPTSAPYLRGLAYLTQQQQRDGSWKVISRSKPFQKYFETGFPHEKNQFISTTATAWATLAFLLSLPESDAASGDAVPDDAKRLDE